MNPHSQYGFDGRCEWGERGIDQLAHADVVIVVDVLSFSTCVDVALARGVIILPYDMRGASARTFADRHGAELAGLRGGDRYSLSPSSFKDAGRGLRCVLPSPNGAALVLRAEQAGSIVVTACFRNCGAVASYAASVGRTFNVVPAGERWGDDTLRPAIEDLLAAGAILGRLPGTKSPEAHVAIEAFTAVTSDLAALMARSASGRELSERGFTGDVQIAGELNVSSVVPRLRGSEFVDENQAGL